jgi:hypothetical protein
MLDNAKKEKVARHHDGLKYEYWGRRNPHSELNRTDYYETRFYGSTARYDAPTIYIMVDQSYDFERITGCKYRGFAETKGGFVVRAYGKTIQEAAEKTLPLLLREERIEEKIKETKQWLKEYREREQAKRAEAEAKAERERLMREYADAGVYI